MIVEQLIDSTVKSVKSVTNNMSIKIDGRSFALILDKLYTDPHGSMVRELSTNAADAHTQVGNPNPFLIQLPGKFDTTFIVRDFGPGLNEEEINLYLNTLFESSKSEDNVLAGGYGLGSKSPFALVGSFNIESYKDGMVYQALWYKGEDGQPILSVYNKEETDEPNGLKFVVPLKLADVEKVRRSCMSQLLGFNPQPLFLSDISNPQTVIDVWKENGNIELKNKFDDISRYSYGSVNLQAMFSNYPSRHIFLMRIGGVVYPIKHNLITNSQAVCTYLNFFTMHTNSITIVDAPIGHLSIPMNRESLSDDDDNNKKIYQILTDKFTEATKTMMKDFYDNLIIEPNQTIKSKNYFSALCKYVEATRPEPHSVFNRFLTGSQKIVYTDLQYISDLVDVNTATHKVTYKTDLLTSNYIAYAYKFCLPEIIDLTIAANTHRYQTTTPIYNFKAAVSVTQNGQTKYKKDYIIRELWELFSNKTPVLLILQSTTTFEGTRVYEYVQSKSLSNYSVIVATLADLQGLNSNNFDALLEYVKYMQSENCTGLVEIVNYSDIPIVKKARIATTRTKRALALFPGIKVFDLDKLPDIWGNERVNQRLYNNNSAQLVVSEDSNGDRVPFSSVYLTGKKVLVLNGSNNENSLNNLPGYNNVTIYKYYNVYLKHILGITDIYITTEDKYQSTIDKLKEDTTVTVYTSDDIQVRGKVVDMSLLSGDSNFLAIKHSILLQQFKDQLTSHLNSKVFAARDYDVNSLSFNFEGLTGFIQSLKNIKLKDDTLFQSLTIDPTILDAFMSIDSNNKVFYSRSYYSSDMTLYESALHQMSSNNIYNKDYILFALNVGNLKNEDYIKEFRTITPLEAYDLIEFIVNQGEWKESFKFYYGMGSAIQNNIVRQIGAKN